MNKEQANELRRLSAVSDGLLDRVATRLDEEEKKNRSCEKMQRDYLIKIARHYHRQLQVCSELLTKQGVPEWVENSDSDGVLGNAVTDRLRWYLARRKDVKPEEAEPWLQAKMSAGEAAVSEHMADNNPF